MVRVAPVLGEEGARRPIKEPHVAGDAGDCFSRRHFITVCLWPRSVTHGEAILRLRRKHPRFSKIGRPKPFIR